MTTQAEVDAYYAEIEQMKRRAPSAQAVGFARTLPTGEKTMFAIPDCLHNVTPTWPNMYTTPATDDAMTTDEAMKWLDEHGIETQLVGGRVQAKDIWTKDGIVYEEWVVVTCEQRWLREWMGY